jgi:beta-lactam-binding protein with PASTA domain
LNNFGSQATVPRVTGMSVAQATQRLQAAGFTVQVSPRAIDSTQQKGTVAYTSPSGGVQADQSTSVMIFVSNGSGSGGQNRKSGQGFPWPFN